MGLREPFSQPAPGRMELGLSPAVLPAPKALLARAQLRARLLPPLRPFQWVLQQRQVLLRQLPQLLAHRRNPPPAAPPSPCRLLSHARLSQCRFFQKELPPWLCRFPVPAMADLFPRDR